MGERARRQAPVIAVTTEQRAAVEGLLCRTDLKPRLRARLEMVQAAAVGHDLAQIVAWSGRSAETVRRQLGRFAAGGIAALSDAPRNGRPAEADAADLAALATLVETPPPRLARPYEVWTAPRLSA